MTRTFLKSKTTIVRKSNIRTLLEPSDWEALRFTSTKVVFTIGPSSHNVDTLSQILEAGATCARIDLTWGPLEFHKQSLRNLQQAVRRTRRLCAVIVDICGREIVVHRQFELNQQGWPIHSDPFDIQRGDKVTFTTSTEATATNSVLPVNYSGFPEMCLPGDTIYVGRYLASGAEGSSLYLKVSDVNNDEVVCEALNEAQLDGLLTVFHMERTYDSLENPQNKLPLFSDADVNALRELSAEFDLDFVALSYTRSASDIRDARIFLNSIGLHHTKIIAKAESRQAVLDFNRILSAADAVIMSRGNLGLDCPPEKMAVIQKNMISCCNMVGKPILLTRIVDTMVSSPRPTRAEATDVANAVLDGCDGFVLGSETLRGKFPVQTIETVLKICKQAEHAFDHEHHFDHLMKEALRAEEQGQLPALTTFSDEDDDAFDIPPDTTAPDHLDQTTSDGSSPRLGMLGGNGHGAPRHSTSMLSIASSGTGSMHHVKSHASLVTTLAAMTHFGGLAAGPHGSVSSRQKVFTGSPLLSKLEAIASSSVRAAVKAEARMIIVFTESGGTASLVAKYRPPMPVIALVVPRLVSDNLRWHLTGRHVARQALIVRGVLPMLAAPDPSGERVLRECMAAARSMALIGAHEFAVCVEKEGNSLGIRIVSAEHKERDTKMVRESDGRLAPESGGSRHLAGIPGAAAAGRTALLHTPSSALDADVVARVTAPIAKDAN